MSCFSLEDLKRLVRFASALPAQARRKGERYARANEILIGPDQVVWTDGRICATMRRRDVVDHIRIAVQVRDVLDVASLLTDGPLPPPFGAAHILQDLVSPGLLCLRLGYGSDLDSADAVTLSGHKLAISDTYVFESPARFNEAIARIPFVNQDASAWQAIYPTRVDLKLIAHVAKIVAALSDDDRPASLNVSLHAACDGCEAVRFEAPNGDVYLARVA